MIGKKITSVPPIIGALSAFEMMKDAALGKDVSGRATALTDEWDDITVDTCIPTDTGVWETGIERKSIEGKWVIVSQYENTEEAQVGHNKWVELLKKNPKSKLTDINNWNL